MTDIAIRIIGIVVIAALIFIALVLSVLLLFENHDCRIPGGIEKKEFSCFRGDLEIRGTVFFPAAKTNLPAAVVCHEFMTSRLFSYPYAMALARSGYAAFCFDFCGGGILCGSDGDSRHMSVLTEIADLRSVIAFAKGQSYTNDAPVLLMGCSQGGLVAALTAAELDEKPGGLILQYPAFSIPDDARKGEMLWMKFDPRHVPEQMRSGLMRIGKCYAEDAMGINTWDVIAHYTGRVLIIQGDKDRIAKISNSRKAEKAYENAGAHVRFQVIPGGRHIFLKPDQINQAAHAVSEFAAQIIETNARTV